MLKSVVGDQADLAAGEADGLVALGVDGHGHQGDGDLLAGGQKLVHFPLGRVGADFLGEFDEIVGGIAHGRDDDANLVAFHLGGDGAVGGAMDFLGIRDAGAAEFLDDQTHLRKCFLVSVGVRGL